MPEPKFGRSILRLLRSATLTLSPNRSPSLTSLKGNTLNGCRKTAILQSQCSLHLPELWRKMMVRATFSSTQTYIFTNHNNRVKFVFPLYFFLIQESSCHPLFLRIPAFLPSCSCSMPKVLRRSPEPPSPPLSTWTSTDFSFLLLIHHSIESFK